MTQFRREPDAKAATKQENQLRAGRSREWKELVSFQMSSLLVFGDEVGKAELVVMES